MTTAQFFVYKRPVAWTALVATLLWGGYAYLAMPQRQDPIIPVRVGVVLTASRQAVPRDEFHGRRVARRKKQ